MPSCSLLRRHCHTVQGTAVPLGPGVSFRQVKCCTGVVLVHCSLVKSALSITEDDAAGTLNIHVTYKIQQRVTCDTMRGVMDPQSHTLWVIQPSHHFSWVLIRTASHSVLASATQYLPGYRKIRLPAVPRWSHQDP